MKWLTFLLLVLAGCFGDKTTAFAPGLDPLDPVDQAPAPAPAPNDPFPEMLDVVTGHASSYYWSDARGYVHAPIMNTWQAVRTPMVCVDRRKVDSWTVTNDVEDYPVSFRIHNVVNDIITVQFDITWREDATLGPSDAPDVISVRYQKTWGSTVINMLAGSVQLRKVDDQTTEIEMIEHLDALSVDSAPAMSFQQDFFASIVAFVHGQPLPTFR